MTQPEAKLNTARIARGDLAGLDALPHEAVCAFVMSDVRPLAGAAGFLDWRMCGALSRALERGFVTGARGETFLLPHTGRTRIGRVFVFGLGPEAELSVPLFASVAEEARATLKKAGVTECVFLAPASRRRPEVERMFVKAASESLKDKIRAIVVEQA